MLRFVCSSGLNLEAMWAQAALTSVKWHDSSTGGFVFRHGELVAFEVPLIS